MLARHAISDADWNRIQDLLPTRGPKADNRRFVDAVLFVARTGIPLAGSPRTVRTLERRLATIRPLGTSRCLEEGV